MKLLFTFLLLICMARAYSQTWNMVANQTTTINSCTGTIYDSGGNGGNYTNNEVSTIVINSGDPAMGATVTFNAFNLQANFDYLYIYAGTDQTGALLATLTGNGVPTPATYTSTNSSLTLYLVTSNSIVASGFNATISCQPIPLCTDGIQNGLETGVDCGGCTSCPPCVSVPQTANATMSATASSYLLPCVGAIVNLSAIGENSIPLLASNFDDGTPGIGWNFVGSGMFDNPCGESPNGTTHIWFGNSSPHPRTLTTNELNVPCGGEICFDLRFSIQGDPGSCEGPDLPNEGVSLMYSIDCGVTFAPIAYFNPDGTIDNFNPMTTTSSTFGATPFTDWANYCFNLPPEAFSDHTIIRWHQEGTSGAGFDHWGIDEVYITATNCTPYYFDWSHIPGGPDPANVTANITETTTFEVLYTNGVNDTLTAQFTVVVDEIFNSTITTVNETCMTYTNGTATFTGNGSTGPYTFTLDGPNGFHQVYTGNPTFTATNLPAGNFTLTTTTANQCSIVDTFSIQQGYPLPAFVFDPIAPHLCFGDPAIQLSAVVSGGLPGYTYQWSTGETTPTIMVGGGTYGLTVTDQRNCSSPYQSVFVNQDAAPIQANAGPDLNVCRQNSAIVNIQGAMQTAGGGIWTGGNGTYTASNTSLNLFYSPTAAEVAQGFVDLTLSSTGNNGCPPDDDQVRITFYSFDEAITLTTQNVSCNGSNDGQATVSTTGVFSPCTFSWDGAAPIVSNTINTLTPGTHSVRIINSMGCDTTLSFSITQPDGLAMSMTPTIAHLCYDDPNILIESTVSGGTAPYVYSWNSGETTSSLSAGEGIHILTVTDQNGCGPVQMTATFTQDIFPIQANSGADINVCRQDPGTIHLIGSVQTATGGIWSGGNGTYSPSVTSLVLDYTPTPAEVAIGYVDLTLTTTGNGNCPAHADVVRINFLSFAENITLTPQNVTCFGYNDGQATVLTTGTYSPGTFSWDGGAITGSNVINNLIPGNHSVRIINSMGCDTTLTFTIAEPQPIALTVGPAYTHLCFGAGPVVLSSTVSGGTLPYSYSWNSGQTSANITVGAGNYILTVTDLYNCPSVAQSAVIEQDPLPILANAGQDIRVCRQNPGIINVIGTIQTATGGIWSGGGGTYTPNNTALNLFYTPTITEVSAGFVDLTLTTTGNNNCPAHSDVMRIYFLDFDENMTFSSTNITCNGANNGTATLVTSGSYSPSTFSWDGGPVTGIGAINNLSPGQHNVRVINSMGCDTTIFFTLTEPDPMSVTVSPVNLHLCFGEPPVTVLSTVTGGTMPYNYSWNTGAITSSITGGAGAYILTVTDHNNCPPVSGTSLITQDLLPILANAGSDVNVCRQDPGSIQLNAAVQTATGVSWFTGGGTYAASTTILNPVYTPTVQEVADGFVDLYVVTTGNNNCPADTDVMRINFLSFAENITLTKTDITCKGYNNGHVTVTTTGTYSPSTFSWDGAVPTTTNTLLSLTPGNHSVRIINSMGCDTTLFYVINEPDALVAQLVDFEDNLCYGDINGSALINVTGGTEPYTYVWNTNPQQNTNNAVNLPGGDYICMVTDIHNCNVMLPVTIIEPTPLSLSFTGVNPSCNGFSNGTIAGNVSGGIEPYTFDWSTGAVSTNIYNVSAGVYALTVEDAHGCTVQNSITITDPPLLVANISNDTTICPDTQATLFVTAVGGTGTYSYMWNPGGMQNDTVVVSPVANQTYTCQVRDNNNCTVNLTTHVFINFLNAADVVASVNSNEICEGDSVYLSAQYLGSDPSVELSWVFCPLCPTEVPLIQYPDTTTFYVIQATNSCETIVYDTVDVIVNQSPNIQLSPVIDSICPGEGIVFENLGDNNPSWSYTWDFGDSTFGVGMGPYHVYAETGNYPVYLSIIDNNGCHSTNSVASWIVVNPSAVANFTVSSYTEDLIDPVFEFTNLSTNASIFQWHFGNGASSSELNPTYEFPEYGAHAVELIANNQYGCADSAVQVINVTASYAIYAPNAFTPNDDYINDVFYFKGYGIKDRNFTALVYNRWGEVIFEAHSMNQAWDGKLAGKEKYCQDGVYIWVVFFEDVTGEKHRKEGHVSLLK